ncbi:MAG: cob(I)yrinic acid a,c-diamide adenosyltransferase [Chromatiales bacterium]|jgi:cob(I)alamin adenosyltransferase
MANRLTRIYTRTGDDGTTGLADGSRLPKDGARVEAIGTVDELNSVIGILMAQQMSGTLREMLAAIQHRLFDLGGELAMPGNRLLDDGAVEWVEARLDALNAALPPLREFVLPGGTPAAAHCHHARALCRRAERCLVHLSRSEPVAPGALRFLNRLSDLLFVTARTLARADGAPEVGWAKPPAPEK